MIAEATPSQETCSVRCFQSAYLTHADHPDPDALRDRLDRVVARQVPEALARLLKKLFDPTDPGLWFIRRVETELAVRADRPAEQIAEAWAARIGRQIAEIVLSDDPGSEAVHFKDRIAYLARFMVDVAESAAWGKWYYRSLDGLRHLPASAAIRTVGVSYGADGIAALLDLAPADWRAVARALEPSDARRLLEEGLRRSAVSGAPEAAHQTTQAVAEACLRAWEMLPVSLRAMERPVTALAMAALALDRRSDPGLRRAVAESAQAAAVVRDVLSRRFASAPAVSPIELIDALTRPSIERLARWVGPENVQRLVPLIGADAAVIRRVVLALRPAVDGLEEAAPVESDRASLRHSPFGAAFLLLPIVDTLPLEAMTAGWPEPEAVAAVDALRWLVLEHTVPRRFRPALRSDGAVREMVGLDETVVVEDLADWARGLDVRLMHAFDAALADWRRQRLRAEPACTTVCPPAASGFGAFGISVDANSGYWFDITNGSAGDAAETHADGPGAVHRNPQRIESELEYLGSAHSDPAIHRALMVAGQNILRTFARRLIGFDHASLPYLWANFLQVYAEIECEADRWIVGLESPPLSVVMRMSGMDRVRFTPRGRRFEIHVTGCTP